MEEIKFTSNLEKRKKILELIKNSTISKVDILVSWNFKHIVNHETRIKVNGVNLISGYDEIKIESPYEVGGGKYVR